jgi:recombination protein RecA
LKNADNTADIGSRVKVKVVKNKCAPPFRAAEFDILFNDGISYIGSLIDVGVDLGLIEKKGAWFSYQTTRLGQGRETVRDELKNNSKLCAEIEQAICARVAEKPDLCKKAEVCVDASV